MPPALTAAGLFAAFASVYAAYDLYHLLAPLVAFLGLALIAALGVALALLQGPFIALLGMAGGFVTPALVESDAPSALALFGYLLTLVAGSLAVVRYKAWWWLAWAAIAGSSLWLAVVRHPVARRRRAAPRRLPARLRRPVPVHAAARGERSGAYGVNPLAIDWLAPGPIALVAAAVAALFVLVLVRVDDYGSTSLAVLALLALAYLMIGRRYPAFEALAVFAALTVVAAMGAGTCRAWSPCPNLFTSSRVRRTTSYPARSCRRSWSTSLRW